MSKKDEGDSGPKLDPDAWMGTLSDLIFLLITFFVLLISMSSLDAQKLKEAFGLFDDALDVLNFSQESSGSNRFVDVLTPLAKVGQSKTGAKKEAETTKGDDKKRARNTRKFLQKMAAGLAGDLPTGELVATLKSLAEDTGGDIKVQKVKKDYALILPGRMFFKSGEFELDEDGLSLLAEVSTLIQLWGGKVDVVAEWNWHDGPKVLARIVETMERNWVNGESLNPELYPGAERRIRFILRTRSES